MDNRDQNSASANLPKMAVTTGHPPEIITKKWLCYRFFIPVNQGATCRRLRKLVFDDQLLSLLELSEDEWKRRREFTRRETIIICQYLQI